MRIRIVLVEPMHEINIGYCCRAMKNFGFGELFLVKPCAVGRKAQMYSKHARDVLANAHRVRSLGAATRGCDFVVGTTGVLRRSSAVLRNPITPREFARIAKGKKAKFAVLFGREGTGLAKGEIAKCDFMVSIPASQEYPVLNVSHALAVVLYELFITKKPKLLEEASGREKETLNEMFAGIVDVFEREMRNADKAKLAFRRVVGRALIERTEARALLGVFQRVRKRYIKE